MASQSMPIGIVAAALSGDLRQAADMARSGGFRGLLLDAAGPQLNLSDLSQSGRRELRQVLSSRDQQLIGLQLHLGPRGLGPQADVDRQLARIADALDTSRGLGAGVVCVDLGPLPPAPAAARPRPRITPNQAGLIILPTGPAAEEPPPPPQAPPDPAFVSQVHAALVELGQHADRIGVMLAMRSELSSFAALHHALDQADCPWFGLDLDPVAVLRDEWSIDEVLSAFAGQVRHVRARDAIRGADRRTTPAVIGQGSTDWADLLSALDAAGYSGWLSLDPTELPNRPPAAHAGRIHLDQIQKH